MTEGEGRILREAAALIRRELLAGGPVRLPCVGTFRPEGRTTWPATGENRDPTSEGFWRATTSEVRVYPRLRMSDRLRTELGAVRSPVRCGNYGAQAQRHCALPASHPGPHRHVSREWPAC